VFSSFSFGQVVSRSAEETAVQFARRLQPQNTVVVHKVIETQWNSKPVLIAFYKQQSGNQIIIKIYVQTQKNKYSVFRASNIDCEGGEPQIENVFFANCDKDAAKELFLIVSWEQRHFDIRGSLYGTFVYDDLSTNSHGELILKKNLSQKLDGGFEGFRDGENVIAKLKTAKAIRSELKRLGYN
jgi:hypothetical protein